MEPSAVGGSARTARPFYADSMHCHGYAAPLGFSDAILEKHRADHEKRMSDLRTQVAARYEASKHESVRLAMKIPHVSRDEIEGVMLLQTVEENPSPTLSVRLCALPRPPKLPAPMNEPNWSDALILSESDRSLSISHASSEPNFVAKRFEAPSIEDTCGDTLNQEMLAAAFTDEVRDLARKAGIEAPTNDDYIHLIDVEGLAPPKDASAVRPKDAKRRWKTFKVWYRASTIARKAFVRNEMEHILGDEKVLASYAKSLSPQKRERLRKEMAGNDEEAKTPTAATPCDTPPFDFLRGSIDDRTTKEVERRLLSTWQPTATGMTSEEIDEQRRVERARLRRVSFLNWYLNSSKSTVNDSTISTARNAFLRRHPATASHRRFQPPAWGFYVAPSTLSETDRRLELKAAISDAVIRKLAASRFRADVDEIHPDDFDAIFADRKRTEDVRLQRCEWFAEWFYDTSSLERQLCRFAFLQRELRSVMLEQSLMRSIRTRSHRKPSYADAVRWYAENPVTRRDFLRKRIDQVATFIERERRSWKLDLLIQWNPTQTEKIREMLAIPHVFVQLPNIDVFEYKWLRLFVDLDLSDRGVELFQIWASFITRYCVDGERWWLLDPLANDDADDRTLRSRELETRELERMYAEDEMAKSVRAAELRIASENRRRERLEMKQEDMLATMIRDNIIIFKFFGTMTSQSDVMDPKKLPKWGEGPHRFGNGFGIDNGDEERERLCALQAAERDEMELEETHMRRVMETERKRRQMELARQQAELERLRRERQRNRLYAMVLLQRELERQRREDPDGLTYRERRRVEQKGMLREDEHSRSQRMDERALAEKAAKEAERLRRQDMLARARTKSNALAVERRRLKRMKDRAAERHERAQMEEEDRESSVVEASVACVLADRKRFEDVTSPFVPFYASDDSKELESYLTSSPSAIDGNVALACRSGQEFLSYASKERKKPSEVIRDAALESPVLALPCVPMTDKMKSLLGLSYFDRTFKRALENVDNEDEPSSSSSSSTNAPTRTPKRSASVHNGGAVGDVDREGRRVPFYRGDFGLVGVPKRLSRHRRAVHRAREAPRFEPSSELRDVVRVNPRESPSKTRTNTVRAVVVPPFTDRNDEEIFADVKAYASVAKIHRPVVVRPKLSIGRLDRPTRKGGALVKSPPRSPTRLEGGGGLSVWGAGP